MSNKRQFLDGVVATMPLVIAAFPFGVVYGAMAQTIELTVLQTVGMSAIVFAGSSQFIAVTLLASAASFPIIVFTIFIVNLRHMLYSANLIKRVQHWPQYWRAPLAFWLTDETFAAVSGRLLTQSDASGLRWFYFGSAIFMYSFWQLSSLLGFLLGQTIPGLSDWGLEIAMIVAFIGIVVPALKARAEWVCALTAVVAGIFCYDWPHQTGLLFSAVIAIVAGLLVERGQA